MIRIKKHSVICFIMLLPFFSFSLNQDPGNSAYLNYVQNKGQWESNILYKTHFEGGSLFLEKQSFTYLFYPAEGIDHHELNDTVNHELTFHSIKMDFKNALPSVTTSGSVKQPFYHNYFLGSDPKKWAKEVEEYRGVLYTNLYEGISMRALR